MTNSWFVEPSVKHRLTWSLAMGGFNPFPLAPTGAALQALSSHQQLDLVAPDLDPSAQGQFGVCSQDAASAVGLAVDLGD